MNHSSPSLPTRVKTPGVWETLREKWRDDGLFRKTVLRHARWWLSGVFGLAFAGGAIVVQSPASAFQVVQELIQFAVAADAQLLGVVATGFAVIFALLRPEYGPNLYQEVRDPFLQACGLWAAHLVCCALLTLLSYSVVAPRPTYVTSVGVLSGWFVYNVLFTVSLLEMVSRAAIEIARVARAKRNQEEEIGGRGVEL